MTDLSLPPTTQSVPLARRFAREQLRRSGCDVDTAVLLVSEVVTNAVLHARSNVRVTIDDLGDAARVEVADGSAMPPRMHSFGVDSATGRGLRMLDQLASTWGVEPGVDGTGKIVWFVVGAPGQTVWEAFSDDLLGEEPG